jgi:hypothetical protein
MANKIEQLIAVYMAPMQRLENTCIDMLTKRSVDTAEGVQLDVLGRIVGQSRLGLSDTDYRRYIRARIATNRSTGKQEELINIARLILNDSTIPLVIHREGTATVIVDLTGAQLTVSLANTLITFLRLAVAAGVRLILRYTLSPTADTFRLDSGPGLDVGYLAGAAE